MVVGVMLMRAHNSKDYERRAQNARLSSGSKFQIWKHSVGRRDRRGRI